MGYFIELKLYFLGLFTGMESPGALLWVCLEKKENFDNNVWDLEIFTGFCKKSQLTWEQYRLTSGDQFVLLL